MVFFVFFFNKGPSAVAVKGQISISDQKQFLYQAVNFNHRLKTDSVLEVAEWLGEIHSVTTNLHVDIHTEPHVHHLMSLSDPLTLADAETRTLPPVLLSARCSEAYESFLHSYL